LAELYHKANQDNKAIEMYEKYLQLNNTPEARYRYGSFLFNKKSYEDAIKEMEALLNQGWKNPYVYRILAYSYYELGDKKDKDAYVKGYRYIQNFFEIAGNNFKYLPSDYKYKGLLMIKNNNDSLGMIEVEKAIKMDSSIANELYKEIAKTALKNKKYEQAASYFDKVNPSVMTAQDWFDAGKAYLFSKQFEKADTAFGNVIAKSPNFDYAYFLKGRTKANLDPNNEKWLAFPYYDRYFQLVKPEERNTSAKKANIIEACEYLGYYYMAQKNKDKATEYYTIIKDLDPNNPKAQAFFKQSQKK